MPFTEEEETDLQGMWPMRPIVDAKERPKTWAEFLEEAVGGDAVQKAVAYLRARLIPALYKARDNIQAQIDKQEAITKPK
jgi:hypothetical protein